MKRLLKISQAFFRRTLTSKDRWCRYGQASARLDGDAGQQDFSLRTGSRNFKHKLAAVNACPQFSA
ncbi:hypothetical protein [Delftia tsuruhatensis]|uniref:hypothetical protein n=1 Tax=Delftia tsuruhatensis TaxID=180282 RepID=UPI00370CA98A